MSPRMWAWYPYYNNILVLENLIKMAMDCPIISKLICIIYTRQFAKSDWFPVTRFWRMKQKLE